MTTYIAANPERWVQIHEPDPKGFGGLIVRPDGTGVYTSNVVTGYKMVVHDDETAYDSFVQVRGDWKPHSIGKTLSERARQQLCMEIASGSLVEVTP